MIKYIVILTLLVSCSSTRHWKKVATDTRVTPEKKAIIAPKVAVLFPTETRYVKGDTVTVIETYENTENLYRLERTIFYLLDRDSVNVDSVKAIIRSLCTSKIEIRYHTRVDTTYMEDLACSATLYSVQNELATATTENVSLKVKLNDAQAKSSSLQKSKNKWLWWLIGAGVLLIGSWVAFFKLK